MITRQLESWLTKVANTPQIIHVFGLRQTGKTTLMNEFRRRYPKALHYPLYDLVTLRRYEREPERWVLELEEVLSKQTRQDFLQVFVDEIQKIPPFFQALQGLYEKHRGKIKFWIWGSSARPLKRQRAETLAGRSFSRTLWPFSQAELLQNESRIPLLFEPAPLRKALEPEEPRGYINSFSRWMRQAMLPEPCLSDQTSLADEILQSYQATFLENEIRRENLVEDIGTFEQFLALAASENTGIVNDASKAKILAISPHTIKNYYGILEDTFVCRKIPAYSQSLRVQISKSPKVYFSDTGLARFLSGERGFPTEASSAFGALLEGFVVNEVTKQIEYHDLPWKLSYLRTKSGMEVDLVISRGSEKIACEIKSARKIDRGDCQSIRTLMEMDSQIQHGIVFSRQPAPFELEKNIFNFPVWNL